MKLPPLLTTGFPSDARCDTTIGSSWRVHVQRGLVTDGVRSRRLEPRSMDLLAYLVRNAGRVVSREELVREVWCQSAVTDGAIARCVGAVRRALDDDASRPTYLFTVPKRGYRIDTPPPSRARWRGGAVLVAAVVLAIALSMTLYGRIVDSPLSVAVVPFRDLDPTAREEGWGAGLTEDLMAELGGSPSVRLLSADPVGPGSEKQAGEPADVVLSGSVRREGDMVRVTCSATEPRRGGTVRCAERCDLDADSRLDGQARIARALAGATTNLATTDR